MATVPTFHRSSEQLCEAGWALAETWNKVRWNRRLTEQRTMASSGKNSDEGGVRQPGQAAAVVPKRGCFLPGRRFPASTAGCYASADVTCRQQRLTIDGCYLLDYISSRFAFFSEPIYSRIPYLRQIFRLGKRPLVLAYLREYMRPTCSAEQIQGQSWKSRGCR
ncbi:hypothetical protein DL95DRAFT_416519 [Leptodontidium sp. 2 PMI_412]|nr:hypothetical protein DL95DRAFT_416519 [Leptodontidium sp. 2 PMI_412]